MSHPTKARIASRLTFGICLLAVLILPLQAQTSSSTKIKEHFVNASTFVFQATSNLFSCFAEGRRNKGSSFQIDYAVMELKDASFQYNEIAKDRIQAKFNYDGTGDVAARVVSDVEKELATSFKTEGDVARANVDAIDRLVKQISVWKDCRQVVNNRDELLKFVNNKITVERVSQVAEVAFSR